MTVAQFRRWLESKIQWAEGADEFNESENQEAEALLSEAYDCAIDLRLPEAAEAARKGPVRLRLVEVLNALPVEAPATLNPADVARQLAVSPATVRGWIESLQLKAANIATGKRPRYIIQKTDLDDFLRNRQPEKPQPRRRTKSSDDRY